MHARGARVASLTFASGESVEATVRRLGTVTDLYFELHESMYRGGDYFLAGDWRTPHSEHVIVQRNEDLDERAVEVDAPTIVHVELTDRAAELIGTFRRHGLALVSREDWDAP
jgi:hypothetical protein